MTFQSLDRAITFVPYPFTLTQGARTSIELTPPIVTLNKASQLPAPNTVLTFLLYTIPMGIVYKSLPDAIAKIKAMTRNMKQMEASKIDLEKIALKAAIKPLPYAFVKDLFVHTLVLSGEKVLIIHP